jgi:hypothetical protein
VGETVQLIRGRYTGSMWRIMRVTSGRVMARKPTGEDLALETVEPAALEGKGNRLTPRELSLLAKRLASANNPLEAARIKERLTRRFYGI